MFYPEEEVVDGDSVFLMVHLPNCSNGGIISLGWSCLVSICMYVCMYVCVCMYVLYVLYVCMCMYVCIVCMYVCMCGRHR